MFGDDLGDLCDVIELFPVRAMGAFDVAIELGTARWQDEEVDALGSAGLFEGGLELAAAVDLDGPHGEAETGEVLGEDALGHRTVLAIMDGEDVLPADDVAGGEVDAAQARNHFDRRGIELDEIARALRDVIPGLAARVEPRGAPTPAPSPPHRSRFDQLTEAAQPRERAADSRSGDGPAVLAQQDGQLELAPPRVLFPQGPDAGDEGGRGLRLADAVGTAGTAIILQAGETPWIVAVPPAIKRGGADPKVPAGQTGVALVVLVEVEPLQASARLARQLMCTHQAEHRISPGDDLAADLHGDARIPPLWIASKPYFAPDHSRSECFASI